MTLLVGRQEGHPIQPVKMGDCGGGHWLVWMEDGVAPSRMVGVSASVNLPFFLCTTKSRSSLLLAPAHPGGPRKRAIKQLWWTHINIDNINKQKVMHNIKQKKYKILTIPRYVK